MCVPALSVLVAYAATPPFTEPVPSTVVPSLNVTVPVVVVGRVAKNVTAWVVVAGFNDELSVILGEPFVTTCVVVPEAGL